MGSTPHISICKYVNIDAILLSSFNLNLVFQFVFPPSDASYLSWNASDNISRSPLVFWVFINELDRSIALSVKSDASWCGFAFGFLKR